VDTREDVIPNSLQLIAGRTGQEYNQRKNRKGAFWEDRYQATAVETDEHLAKCLVYIDLNMVGAGVVKPPSEYTLSGFNEIQRLQKRYTVLDLFSVGSEEHFREEHKQWVETEQEAAEIPGWQPHNYSGRGGKRTERASGFLQYAF